MAPGDKLKSGEHRANPSGEFVTYAHFSEFMAEFRTFTGRVETSLHEVEERLSEGSTKFALQEREITGLKKKTDDHSDTIKDLTTDKATREALSAQAVAFGTPARSLREKIIENLLTALLLAAFAVGYNLWRDSTIKEARITTTSTTSTSVTSPPPAVAPAHGP